MKITKKYLMLPLNNNSDTQQLLFKDSSGNVLYRINAKINKESPVYYNYLNMSPYIGAQLDAEFTQLNELPDSGTLYKEINRPQVRFSAKYGWLNDPNGLIYINGTYHLFFQHNPAGNEWGNMHWGHAISNDLLHWREVDIALYPDDMGTMFSGSAIYDEHNVTGLGYPILLYYTAAGDPFTQCMAYSLDGGYTFIKYEKNPVIPHIIGSNRDPKVIYCNELNKYALVLYLDGNTFAIFTSDNLLDWEMIQKIDLPGDAECPDFYPLTIDNERKWIFSGASDYYYIGTIKDGQYVPEQSIKRLHKGDSQNYASQTYSGTGNRVIRISWNRQGIQNECFNMHMSFPIELSLKRADDSSINLCAEPIREIVDLYTDNGEGLNNGSFHIKGINSNGEEFTLIYDRSGYELFNADGSMYTALPGVIDDILTSSRTLTEVNNLKSIWN